MRKIQKVDQVYLDMDGVLVNLLADLTIIVRHLLAHPTDGKVKDLVEKIKAHPEYETFYLTENYLFEIHHENDRKPLEGFKKLVHDLTYYPLLKNKDFWVELKPYDYARELYVYLIKKVGIENVTILTQPTDDASIRGKEAWLHKHFPMIGLNVRYASDKDIYATPGALLIDDRVKHTRAWLRKGGHAITFRTMGQVYRFFEF